MAYNIRAMRNQQLLKTVFNNLRSPANPNPKTLIPPSSLLRFLGIIETSRFLHSRPDESPAAFVQNLLKFRRDKPTEQVEHALDLCGFDLNDDLVLDVLKRHRSDWRPAFVFFNWASKSNNYKPSSLVCNEILDILGKMKRFEELYQLLDEMSQREGLINEEIFGTLLRRFAGAHKVDEAIGMYKHVEEAETLFHSKMNELQFRPDIKTWNVILNGWCVLGNTHEAKRLWKDIMASKSKPDLFTYGTFINALTKKGKLGTALKLFRGMWNEDCKCKPDVVICNCIIDALCFKKRVPEALEHLCKIRRMEKVYELVEEMERRKGCCLPNAVTYCYLLKSLKEPGEVPGVLERMERNGVSMSDDVYNLVLRRSYTIMIHGHYENGRMKDAMRYFREMTSKGMVPEPRTEKLVISMNSPVEGENRKTRRN
ncbi:Tetratricopeptide-like helical domain superfamily [Sesbania bispinosa]|nr:Tetratricopeptide-like helical domain superfamily [Sesbania bispinosa]